MTSQLNGAKGARAVIGASGTRDGAEAPTYAVFDIDHAFLATVVRLANVCTEYKLTEVRATHYPAWGPGGIEEELRLQNGELVVQSNGTFRFTDHPESGGYQIHTSDIDIDSLRNEFESAGRGDVIFLAGELYVRQYYEQDYEEAACESAHS